MKNTITSFTVFLVFLYVPCSAQHLDSLTKELMTTKVKYTGYASKSNHSERWAIQATGWEDAFERCHRSLRFSPNGSLTIDDLCFTDDNINCDVCNIYTHTDYGTWEIKKDTIIINPRDSTGWLTPYLLGYEMPTKLVLDSLGSLKSADNPLMDFHRQ